MAVPVPEIPKEAVMTAVPVVTAMVKMVVRVMMAAGSGRAGALTTFDQRGGVVAHH